MAKEKWLIDPGELDEFQREILEIGLDQSAVIKGSAGSGKTILALYRANRIRIQALAKNPDVPPSFTIVVFSTTLKTFIRSAINALGINIKQVIHFEKWDESDVDYIIVDEAQDFNKEDIDILKNASRKPIMLYGDS